MEIQRKEINSITICVDFDGTCVTHEFPNIGSDIGAVPVLKLLVKNGHRLILSTMRSNKPFKRFDGTIDISGLDNAVNWFKENDIELYGIQPNSKKWTDSPKAYGQLYIDDAALGCPLIYPQDGVSRPYVNWSKVNSMLWDMGLFKFEPEVTPEETIKDFIGKGKICLRVCTQKYNLFLDKGRTPNDIYNYKLGKILLNNNISFEHKEELIELANKYKDNYNWVIVRNYDEFVKQISNYGIPENISFDHDLADISGPNSEGKTIMDCAIWLRDIYLDHEAQPFNHTKWVNHDQMK